MNENKISKIIDDNKDFILTENGEEMLVNEGWNEDITELEIIDYDIEDEVVELEFHTQYGEPLEIEISLDDIIVLE